MQPIFKNPILNNLDIINYWSVTLFSFLFFFKNENFLQSVVSIHHPEQPPQSYPFCLNNCRIPCGTHWEAQCSSCSISQTVLSHHTFSSAIDAANQKAFLSSHTSIGTCDTAWQLLALLPDGYDMEGDICSMLFLYCWSPWTTLSLLSLSLHVTLGLPQTISSSFWLIYVCFFFKTSGGYILSIHRGVSGVCSVPCHFESGLLQFAVCLCTQSDLYNWSRMQLSFLSPQVFWQCSIAILPLLVTSSCPAHI